MLAKINRGARTRKSRWSTTHTHLFRFKVTYYKDNLQQPFVNEFERIGNNYSATLGGWFYNNRRNLPHDNCTFYCEVFDEDLQEYVSKCIVQI